MASINPFEVPIGASKLYSASVRFGEINVSTTAIAESLTRLTRSMDTAFYPVVMTGKNDHTPLKDALFEGAVRFSSASEYIHVNVKSNIDPIQIQHLIPSIKQIENLNSIARNLFAPMKGLSVALFGVCAQDLSEGQSTESHKEFTDKDQVRILLVSLSEDEEGHPLVFADEVMFKNDESKGPRGSIDLFIGSKCESDIDNGEYTLYSIMSNVSWICQASFAETKKESESLSRVDEDVRYKLADGSYLEIGCVAQPVLEAVSISQVETKANRPLVLFFASRSYIRPFLYYKDSDVMLTTKHEIQWKSKNGLCIDGVALTAVLLCARSPLKYDDMSVTKTFFELASIPKTGFLQALNESSFTFKNAHLKASNFETNQNKRRADHLSKLVPLDIENKYDTLLKKSRQSQPNQL